ncbi:MAG: TonB-dependent receptor domain-containing protein [Pyrinomonadaceae bacterium]
MVKTFTSCFLLILCLCHLCAAKDIQDTFIRIQVIDRNSDAVFEPNIRLFQGEDLVREELAAKSKTVTFNKLTPGEYRLEVSARGFAESTQTISLVPGANEIVVRLQIAEIVENIDIDISKQEKSLSTTDGAFSTILTPQDIEALPDDPDELRAVLQGMAGPGADIKVDGESADRLPPKKNIASIKIVRSSFDAEFHEGGYNYVDIRTKVGNKPWTGQLGFSPISDLLSARPYFSEEKPSFFRSTFNYSLSGTLVKNKASLYAWGFMSGGSSATEVNAILPTGQYKESVKNRERNFYSETTLNLDLIKNNPIKVVFTFGPSKSYNYGVGGKSLPERAYDRSSMDYGFRASTSGPIGKRFYHEFRMKFARAREEITPLHNEPSINVIGAFNGGGSSIGGDSTSKLLTLNENVVFGAGNHIIKFGGEFGADLRNARSRANANGTFTFSTLEEYEAGNPSLYSVRMGERQNTTNVYRGALFLQDDIKITKAFMVNLGLRYEIQSRLDDHNNFSPRIGFAWAPTKDGNVTIRAGAGIYYRWFNASDIATINENGADQPPLITVQNPSFTDPLAGANASQMVNTVYAQDPNLSAPYVFLTQIDFSKRFKNGFNFQTEYSYSKTVHNFRSRDLNSPINGVRPNSNQGALITAESSSFLTSSMVRVSGSYFSSKGTSAYLSWQVGRMISDADGTFDIPTDNYFLAGDRGYSDRDIRQRINLYYTKSLTDKIKVGTNGYISTSKPYTITTGYDNNGDLRFADRPAGVSRNTERGSTFALISAFASYTYSFGKAPQKTSNDSMIIVIGGSPALNKDDKKRYSLQFSVTATNILNRSNFSGYDFALTSPNYGKPTTAGAPFGIRMGINFGF